MSLTKGKYSLEYLQSLTPDELEYLVERKQAAIEYKRTHKIHFFKPYDYQKKFYDAGGTHYDSDGNVIHNGFKHRYLRAGNRTGKTLGTAYEMAYHLTGLYPKDWKGLRVVGSGHTFACIGISLDSVAKVMQKELFGVEDARVKSQLGTGSIPKDCIELNEGWNSDGPVIRSCKIKSVYGGYNTIMFYGSNNLDVLMGLTLKGVWLDEEPPFNSLELYSQAVTRTATTDGFVILTATPEQGLTPLNLMYEENKDGLLYLQSASWDECPHITPEIRKQLLAGIPSYQHLMRSNGIPVIGSGAVFPYTDDDITVNDVFIQDDWLITGGIDFGQQVDPSVIFFSVYDPKADKYYLLHEIYLDEDRSPKAIAEAIKASPYPYALFVLPPDAYGEAPETAANQLQYYGIKIFTRPFRNPTETKLGLNILKTGMGHVAKREPGWQTMRFMFDENKLFIHRSCQWWLKEKRGFFYKPNNGNQEETGADHAMDASRYSLLSLLGNIYTTVAEAKNSASMRFNSFSGYNF